MLGGCRVMSCISTTEQGYDCGWCFDVWETNDMLKVPRDYFCDSEIYNTLSDQSETHSYPGSNVWLSI